MEVLKTSDLIQTGLLTENQIKLYTFLNQTYVLRGWMPGITVHNLNLDVLSAFLQL